MSATTGLRRIGAGFLLLAAAELARGAAPGEELRRHVDYLASAELEGRLTGSDGERKAADHIAASLRSLGAEPLPGLASFLQPFEFTAGIEDAGSALALRSSDGPLGRWQGSQHVRALSFSDTAAATGELVFAGYGITVPEGSAPAYDSFAGLDLRDKIVLVLRYSPEDATESDRATLARYAGLRYKALRVRELGAKALLVATGPRSPNAGETIAMSFDAALSGSGIVAASIDAEVAGKIFKHAGKDLDQVQRALDAGNPHAGGFKIPGLTLDLDVKVQREKRTGHNVLGLLAAGGEQAQASGFVILGAHYDHLGRGGHGNSLAKKDEMGGIHHGADDNASGVAAVLAAGAEIARSARRRPVLLAFWSGEELGLLGSTHFIKDSLPRERIAAYVNLDMVGRMRENKLSLQGAGSSSVWNRLIEQVNVPIGFDVRTQEDPYLPTDSSTFYQAGVPTLSLFTGSHEDYHRPSDVAARINYEDLARIAQFTALLAGRLSNLETPPDYLKVAPKLSSGGDRDSVRAYTGTIPDYTTEVQGLRLSGVIGGGPAEQAGLREGDVIVEFAGRSITNIYDYTYALDSVKVGRPVRVVFLRDGARREATITPTSRP